MWEFFEKKLNNSKNVNKTKSFYCGDREDDNNFANNVGVQFFSEKKFFTGKNPIIA